MDAATRRLVRDRAEDWCEYCRLPQSAFPFLTFHIEHIYARQHVQDDRESNLCLACPNCNLHKGPNLTSLSADGGEILPLFNPREQTWDDHFEVVGGKVIGRTTIGEVTAKRLQMNVDDHLQIRRSLIARDEF